MKCIADCPNDADFEYRDKPYCYPHYLAQIASNPPTKPKRERPDDIRLLQHVFNVLMYNGVLDFKFSADGETSYVINKVDPFYIEDEAYREMERKFEADHKLSTGTKPQQN